MALKTTPQQATATATFYDLATGVATGTEVLKVQISSNATTSLGLVKLYLFDGSNRRFLAAIPVPAITVSTTVPGFFTQYFPEPLTLDSTSDKLQAEISVTNTIDFITTVFDH